MVHRLHRIAQTLLNAAVVAGLSACANPAMRGSTAVPPAPVAPAVPPAFVPAPVQVPSVEPVPPACPAGVTPSDLSRPPPGQQPAAVLEATDPDFRRDLFCGQHLNHLLTQDTYTAAGLADAPRRQATLEAVQWLLNAGQVPRDEAGRSQWFHGATHWLVRNRPLFASDAPIPFRQDFYDLFETRILPRMAVRDPEDGSGAGLQQFLAEAIVLPDALALKTLRQLKAWQMLPPPLAKAGEDNPVQSELWRALSPEVSDDVFRLLVEAAGPMPRGGRDLLYRAIDDRNPVGLKRLLASGADPLANGVIERAKGSQRRDLYDLLRQEAQRRGATVPEYVDLRERNSKVQSVYTCRTQPVPGQATQGTGGKGCHFVLRDPATGQVLANTRYHLDALQDSPGRRKPRTLLIDGVTDAEGRSTHLQVRDDNSITAERFVQVIGSGPYGGSFTAAYGPNQVAPGVFYRLFGCNDTVVYEGRTDARGHTVRFESPTACTYRMAVIGGHD